MGDFYFFVKGLVKLRFFKQRNKIGKSFKEFKGGYFAVQAENAGVDIQKNNCPVML